MKQRVVKILEQNDLSVKEKYDRIEELQNEFNKYCSEAKKKLIAHYDYCPYCKTYYRKNTWEVEHFYKQEEAYEPTKADEFSLSCSTAAILKVLNVPYLRKTCPVGHIIEVKDENSSLV
jgi:hypothetical protein